MFNRLVGNISKELPDFGVSQAVDGKAISSHATGNNTDSKKSDGRRDTDGDWAKKVYKGRRKDGTLWEKVVKWFGYRLHLIVDTKYELPIAYELKKASESEIITAHELIAKEDENHPELLKRCDNFAGDRGYDDGKLVEKLWDDYDIKPVIDIRNCWNDGEETKLVEGQTNIVYNFKGTVSCVCLKTGDQREMAFGGFEKDRMSLKYRCPAEQYGMECSGAKECPVNNCIRIPLEEDRRIFTPLARSTYKWKNEYNKRTAVERVNGRIETVLGFDKHFIRGIKKMKMRVSLALCIMLAMALGRIQQNQDELMRSIVKRAG